MTRDPSNSRQISASLGKYLRISANINKYPQRSTRICKYLQISANISTYRAFGVSLAVLGHLWYPFGAPWAALGRLLNSVEKVCSFSEHMCPNHRVVSTYHFFRTRPWSPRSLPKWWQQVLLRLSLPHGQEARMTGVEQTPSNYYTDIHP